MKAIKISPSNEITVLDNWKTDQDYANNITSGCSLCLPEFWEHRKYKLSVFMLDTFEPKDAFNPIATKLFQKLKSPSGPDDQNIFGFMIICNEDEEQEIDFTLEDYHYILSKLDNITYIPRARTFDWVSFLERSENAGE